MKLTLRRTELNDEYTAGELFLNDEYFCRTLEDPNRDSNKNGIFDNGEKKIYGNTCIPYGEYRVIVNMSPKFGRELPRLLDVPEFTGILIHRGNTVENTEGCILVGESVSSGYLSNSTPFEERLVSVLKEAQDKGEEISITIV